MIGIRIPFSGRPKNLSARRFDVNGCRIKKEVLRNRWDILATTFVSFPPTTHQQHPESGPKNPSKPRKCTSELTRCDIVKQADPKLVEAVVGWVPTYRSVADIRGSGSTNSRGAVDLQNNTATVSHLRTIEIRSVRLPEFNRQKKPTSLYI